MMEAALFSGTPRLISVAMPPTSIAMAQAGTKGEGEVHDDAESSVNAVMCISNAFLLGQNWTRVPVAVSQYVAFDALHTVWHVTYVPFVMDCVRRVPSRMSSFVNNACVARASSRSDGVDAVERIFLREAQNLMWLSRPPLAVVASPSAAAATCPRKMATQATALSNASDRMLS